jgi:hypothetical protein
MHNFERIAVLDADFPKRRAWDDFKVALDRDARGVESKLAQHRGNAGWAGHPAWLAIELDREELTYKH